MVCFVIRSERRKILKKWDLSVKMKIRKGAICRYTGALGLEVLDRRYVFAPEAAMRQAMDSVSYTHLTLPTKLEV